MRIFLKIKPKASQAKVVKIDDAYYQIFITRPPEKGKANKQIIKLLADYFNVSSSQVKIITGEKGRQKVVEIF